MRLPISEAEVAALAERPVPSRLAVIDGEPSEAASGHTRAVHSPIDGARLAEIPDCGPEDVDRAVRAARTAFQDRRWAGLAPRERKRRMLRWADLIETEAAELAVLETRDMGMPIGMASGMEIPFAIDALRWYAEAADKIYDETKSVDDEITALITRAPLGVVGAILPWNAPAMISAWKLGPALITGNSVILKPSEDASLTPLRIVHLALEAGIPDGVVQAVTGDAVAGSALSRHMDVDVITFTGSGEVGRKLLRDAADTNMKRVHLELGGKSANIVMADAPDLGMAADVSVGFAFSNQGQVCEAPTRLLVQNSIRERFIEDVVKRAAAKRVGNPLRFENDLGPVVNQAQFDQILARIARAESEGVRLALDGRKNAARAGLYLPPTVAAPVPPDNALAQEEIFGPVLSVIGFDSIDEAIVIANGTRYGLAAMVWSPNIDVIMHASRHLVAGVIHVNGGSGPLVELPHGGFRESGAGRDRSLHAIDNYVDLKAIILRSVLTR
jgi:acyl-CoA reductase-like NAD-dependent aldehyde dehydrogenase